MEDDPGIATQLVRGLSRSGYTVDHVMTGREALDRADPDVVLLDLGLPDGDGVDVCRQLSQRSGLAIIVVTARGEEPERVLALDGGRTTTWSSRSAWPSCWRGSGRCCGGSTLAAVCSGTATWWWTCAPAG